MDELISIIVPIYNIEEYLRNCLDSILAQTYRNIEIVVVDDGSTDHSDEIAEEYARCYPDKFQVIHQKNSGVVQARRTGILAARGEWIGFVDGDDEIEPDMYQRLLENAHKYQADISHCGHQTIVNNGERIHYFYNTGRLVQQDRISGLKDLIAGEFVEPSLCNKIFRRSLFQSLLQTEVFPSNIRMNEDLLMNYYLFKVAKTSVYEDICLYHYLSRASSATRSGFQAYKVLDPVRVRKLIYEDAEPAVKETAWKRYMAACFGAYFRLYGRTEYVDTCAELKQELLSYQSNWKTLGNKEQVKIRAMLTVPKIYKGIYWIYEKYFQRKRYE